ncbi:zinc finger protein RFP-like [Rhineura floridana]|uniref:zinc finger protein RFP-like n=1 Tax=Rhineura floridana TaxID=261503 RepID=UPI002AC875AC|nr:zinc finger protein RFP-like [Rhineura floridana]
MTAENPRKRLRYEASCPICLDYFADPVTLECGHNFCQTCIIRCWAQPGTEATCPQCRRSTERNFNPNRPLANIAEILSGWELSAEREVGAGRVECERHQEPLKLFCKDDGVPICVVCDRSREHRDHNVVPVEEAAQEYKDHICSHLKILKKERKKILAYKADTENESKDLLVSVAVAGK